jgi:hypothetical protein
MFNTLLRSKLALTLLTFYGAILIWWFLMYLWNIRETDQNYYFGVAYPFIALIGGLNGIFISRIWGGYKSLVGRGILFFSLGLLGQAFGQFIWSYYNIIAKIEVPYPSIADVGYFSIVPFYSLGMLSFAKAANSKVNLKKVQGKAVAVLLPLLMVSISYFLFLRNLEYDFSDPLKVFFDFGYPFGEAIIISIALVTLGLSKNILGGQMRSRIIYLIFAIVVIYITEYTFIFKANDGTYYNGGPVDMMYATAFFVMSLGLISFKEYE